MASFKVLETQFQMFIKLRMYMDDEYVVMTRNYFLQYTQLEIPEFRDTLIQHMESTTEDKVDSRKALDASLVDTESSGTTLKEQDTSNRSGNDAHADDANIRPYNDEEQNGRDIQLLKSISLLLDNIILSKLNSIMKERLTRMLNNVMTHVLCLLH
ncbi:hypothetical protein Tco_0648816 [Tanacetum coccineum]